MTYHSLDRGILALVAIFAIHSAAAVAGQENPDPQGGDPGSKVSYHLFHPTPSALMRDMSTDRPDQTESPYTVDAGHIQIECDLVNATFHRERTSLIDMSTTDWAILPINVKVGILNNLDLQILFDPYIHSTTRDHLADTRQRHSGSGELSSRLKLNLWGNDGGKTALALMPFLKWPLSRTEIRNGETEGGLIVPLAVDLSRGWGMGIMAEIDFVRNETDDGFDTDYVQSVTFSRDLSERIGGYVELFSVVSSVSGSDWHGQADGGLTYGLNANTQLDLGCNFGLTDSAPDLNPFVGLSLRF